MDGLAACEKTVKITSMKSFLKNYSVLSGLVSDYVGMCKLRVVLLMLLTAIVGMYLAVPRAADISQYTFFWANIGIGLCACSAAVVNHLVDRHIDAIMMRTHKRPLVQGKVTPRQAIIFAGVLGVLGFCILFFKINALTAYLTLLSLIGYAGIYTGYLKRATPQNIVIGGLAGAAPPLLGWTAVCGHFEPQSLLLVLIIFVWTPPHFWALAIARYEDYSQAKIPMLPVTHGIPFTKLQIVLYTALLTAATLLTYAIGMSGWLYLVGAVLLNCRFWYWVIKLKNAKEKAIESVIAMKTFRFSIVYLMLLCVFLLVDHYWR
jgi:protoheme IX farnesyltransferase